MLTTASLTLLSLLISAALALSGAGSPVAVAHLAFAVGIVPLIFAAISHFVPVLKRTGDPEKRIRWLPGLAQILGLFVVATLQGWLPRWALHPIVTVYLIFGLIFLHWIITRARRCLGSPHPGWRWYGAALGALILALLSLANLCFHLAAHGAIALSPLPPLHAALGLILIIESVIGGRVIPAFTMSAHPGLKLVRKPWLEWTTVGLTALGLAWWVVAPTGWPGALALGAAGMLHLRRLLGWKPELSSGKPILWILHAAYAWMPLGLMLLALSQAGMVPESLGVHALAVGVTGGLIIGMMTRTARGHTGRPLQTSQAEVVAYVLVLSSALLRVVLPLLTTGITTVALILAGAAWSLAFLIYLLIFTPWLMQTRLDGKDG